jgi:hypothetical protein
MEEDPKATTAVGMAYLSARLSLVLESEVTPGGGAKQGCSISPGAALALEQLCSL